MASWSEHRGLVWFWDHQVWAGVVAGALFLAVGAGVWVADSAAGVDFLFLMPIALLAMTFGIRGGVVGALVALVELGAGVAGGAVVGFGVLGWCMRVVSMVGLGLVLGVASDQIRSGRRRERVAEQYGERLAGTARRQANTIEDFDSILQRVVVAKWLLEAGRSDDAVVVLGDAVAAGQQIVGMELGEQVGSFVGDDEVADILDAETGN